MPLGSQRNGSKPIIPLEYAEAKRPLPQVYGTTFLPFMRLATVLSVTLMPQELPTLECSAFVR
jgi:hypothetical protein